MTADSAADAARSSPAKRWLHGARRMPLVRLLVLFVILLAADIAAQLGRIWAVRHATSGGADLTSFGAAVLLAAAIE